MLKRIIGVIAILIGLGGLVGSICALAGMFDIPSRRGPLGTLAISCVFLFVGWNWVQNKAAH